VNVQGVDMTPEQVMAPEMEKPTPSELDARQCCGIGRELRRIEQFDQHVRETIATLWARIHLLEENNDDLRTELGERQRFEGKE
jgi:hypothetical protein